MKFQEEIGREGSVVLNKSSVGEKQEFEVVLVSHWLVTALVLEPGGDKIPMGKMPSLVKIRIISLFAGYAASVVVRACMRAPPSGFLTLF